MGVKFTEKEVPKRLCNSLLDEQLRIYVRLHEPLRVLFASVGTL
jgi:hypothetical protein